MVRQLLDAGARTDLVADPVAHERCDDEIQLSSKPGGAPARREGLPGQETAARGKQGGMAASSGMAVDEGGVTAMELAEAHGHTDIAQLIQEHLSQLSEPDDLEVDQGHDELEEPTSSPGPGT